MFIKTAYKIPEIIVENIDHSLLLFENTVLSTFVFEVVPYTWLMRTHAAASLSPGVLSRHSVTWSSASPAVVALNAVRSKRNFSSKIRSVSRIPTKICKKLLLSCAYTTPKT
jgi:hypothetical protein